MSQAVSKLRIIRPFVQYALEYYEKGWLPLPLPPNSKADPPTGFTGRHPAFDEKQVKAWINECRGENLGVRLPDGVLGIDVDAYGDKLGRSSLIAFEKVHGKLPQTWTMTARGDGMSGIRLYKVRRGYRWPGKMASGIDLVSFRYRYIVGWPSFHPELKSIYHIYPPGSELDGVSFLDELPFIDELPLLEMNFQRLISNVEYVEKSRSKASAGVLLKALLECPNVNTVPCVVIQNSLDKCLAEFKSGSDIHDTLNCRVRHVVALAFEGHSGSWTALNEIREAFYAALSARD